MPQFAHVFLVHILFRVIVGNFKLQKPNDQMSAYSSFSSAAVLSISVLESVPARNILELIVVLDGANESNFVERLRKH